MLNHLSFVQESVVYINYIIQTFGLLLIDIKLWDISQSDNYHEFFSLDCNWDKIAKQYGAFNITSRMELRKS